MQKKSEDLSASKAKELAGSPAGQQLIHTLQQTDPEAISRARAALQTGNYEDAQRALKELLKNPTVQTLLKHLED